MRPTSIAVCYHALVSANHDLINHRALSQLGLEELSDACDRLSIRAHIAGVRSLWPVEQTVVGSVVTVELVDEGYPRSSSSHLGSDAIDSAEPGQVIVVDHKANTRCAGWGGLLSEGAAAKGLAGTVVFGAARDIEQAQGLGYPLYGLSSTPVSARGRVVQRAYNEAIQCDGVTIRPDDVAVLRPSGILVLPKNAVGEVVELAQELEHRESRIREQIRAGSGVAVAMGAEYESMLSNRDGEPAA